MINTVRSGIYFFVIVGVLGCGGGDGGSGNQYSATDPWGDGLGTTGRAVGTIQIANGVKGNAAVTLDGTGNALAVWAARGTGSFFWNRGTSSGVWATASILTQAQPATSQFYPPALRTNPDGSSVLGWSEGSEQWALRYTAGPIPAWASSKLTMPTSTSNYLWNRSDLALLADGTLVFSSGGSTSAAAYKRAVADSGWTTQQETTVAGVADRSHVATNSDGIGVLFWIEGTPASGLGRQFRFQRLDFGAAPASTTSGTEFAVSREVCYGLKPVMGVTSPTNYTVAAVLHSNSGCDFDLVRIDASGAGTMTGNRMNAPNTEVLNQPIIAMSQDGNAIAIWPEVSQSGSSSRLVWSTSIQGAAWSAAMPFANIANIDEVFGSTLDFGFAMNANGQAVAAVKGKGLKSGQELLAVGRFSFAGGWSAWEPIAGMLGMTSPAVAINASGNAIVVYGGTPCDRLPGPGAYANCVAPAMYARTF